ncbi:MAG: DCC1-like thiol-disulfide oxidoreductase family protein [Phycisphaeraceae bacterium]
MDGQGRADMSRLTGGDVGFEVGGVTGPVLFFDGGCGFCRGSVAWVASKDHRGVLRYAPLGGETAGLMGVASGSGSGSAVLVDEAGEVHRRSGAVLRSLVVVGGFWGGLARVGLWVPGFLRDFVYGRVARVRRWLPGPRKGKCVMPRGRVLG